MNQLQRYFALAAAILVLSGLEGCVQQKQDVKPGLKITLPIVGKKVWRDTTYTKKAGKYVFNINIKGGSVAIDGPSFLADSLHAVVWHISSSKKVRMKHAAAAEGDYDGDGIPDAEDNCPDVYNPSKADTDVDGIGDACDPTPEPQQDVVVIANDSDSDGWPDDNDNCPDIYNPSQLDTDTDGIGDPCDISPEGRIRGGWESYTIVDLTEGEENLTISLSAWGLDEHPTGTQL